MSDRTLLAWSDALAAASAALRRHAAAADDDAGEPPAESPVSEVVDRARALHPLLGARQAQVLEVLADARPHGTDTGQISRQLRYDQPNVYLTLQALIKLGMVERDSTARPHRYRLSGALV